jgi:hypothetical protein
MTEADWLTATDPAPMLTFLGDTGRLSERKARLFSVACCRRVWPYLADERSRWAVELAERFADGLASGKELTAAARAAHDAYEAAAALPEPEPVDAASVHAVVRRVIAMAAAIAACSSAGSSVSIHGCEAALTGAFSQFTGPDLADLWDDARFGAAYAAEAALLRDLFANPFRPAPGLVPAYRAPTVLFLARAAYDHRELPPGTLAPARLAELADALEHAGCADAELLGHLCSPGPHVRGCWAVDAALGKT